MLTRESGTGAAQVAEYPTVLIATADPEIRNHLTGLFPAFPLNAIWVKGVEAAKAMISTKRIAACLCGFWLQDGTYRELVRHIRRKTVEIPLIIVSAPGCTQEYQDYLATMNIGAFDFLYYPYRRSHLEEKLQSVIKAHARSLVQPVASTGSMIETG